MGISQKSKCLSILWYAVSPLYIIISQLEFIQLSLYRLFSIVRSPYQRVYRVYPNWLDPIRLPFFHFSIDSDSRIIIPFFEWRKIGYSWILAHIIAHGKWRFMPILWNPNFCCSWCIPFAQTGVRLALLAAQSAEADAAALAASVESGEVSGILAKMP